MSIRTPTDGGIPDVSDAEEEADKLPALEPGHIVEYEAYDGDLIEHDSREKKTYTKRVTSVSQMNGDERRRYIHVVDVTTGEKTLISPNTRHNRKGMNYLTGGVTETMGPHATHPDSWTRSVMDLRVVDKVNPADYDD